MSYDTLRNTAQPAFQAGRSAATTPITSSAVTNPGPHPGPAGAPPGLSPQGSVAPGGMPFQQQAAPGGAFAAQTQPWATGGNPAIQAELMQASMGQAQAPGSTALGSAMGAFAGGRGSTSPMMAPTGRFGGK